MKLKKQNGFSLIELLIVVAIIGIIAAIAVPNLLSARRSANSASGLQTLRNVHSANVTYQTSIGRGNFAPALANLSGAGNADVGFLDVSITNSDAGGPAAPKSGYLLTYTQTIAAGVAPAVYAAVNNPSVNTGITRTGNDSYFINESGVLRSSGNPAQPAVVGDNPIN